MASTKKSAKRKAIVAIPKGWGPQWKKQSDERTRKAMAVLNQAFRETVGK